MKKINFIKMIGALFALTIFNVSALAQELTSPNGRLKSHFALTAQGEPTYTLTYDGKEVIKQSKLGFYLLNNELGDLVNGFEVVGTTTDTLDETWTPVWGEADSYRNHYNELRVDLHQPSTDRRMSIRFRLFDDGLGFRYEFPSQKNLIYFTVKEEATEFAMAGDHTAWWIAGDYDTQEFNYTGAV